jgi:hypothetical protein
VSWVALKKRGGHAQSVHEDYLLDLTNGTYLQVSINNGHWASRPSPLDDWRGLVQNAQSRAASAPCAVLLSLRHSKRTGGHFQPCMPTWQRSIVQSAGLTNCIRYVASEEPIGVGRGPSRSKPSFPLASTSLSDMSAPEAHFRSPGVAQPI